MSLSRRRSMVLDDGNYGMIQGKQATGS